MCIRDRPKGAPSASRSQPAAVHTPFGARNPPARSTSSPSERSPDHTVGQRRRSPEEAPSRSRPEPPERRPGRRKCGRVMACRARGHGTVSYTHLDVYKRQVSSVGVSMKAMTPGASCRNDALRTVASMASSPSFVTTCPSGMRKVRLLSLIHI